MWVTDASLSLTYGLNRVRFIEPLRVGAEYRSGLELLEVVPVTGGLQTKVAVRIDGSRS